MGSIHANKGVQEQYQVRGKVQRSRIKFDVNQFFWGLGTIGSLLFPWVLIGAVVWMLARQQ